MNIYPLIEQLEARIAELEAELATMTQAYDSANRDANHFMQKCDALEVENAALHLELARLTPTEPMGPSRVVAGQQGEGMPDCGSGWRILGQDDVIRNGDEYVFFDYWKIAKEMFGFQVRQIHGQHNVYRRRIEITP